MKNKKKRLRIQFYFLFILLTSWNYVRASDSLTLIKSITTKSHLITTDHLGNLYVVKGNNILVKYNSSGDSVGVFNEIKKGKVSHIDATNPLRILLFFSDYNQIVILDNMLSKKNIIKLNTLGLFNVSAIANSADGTIWAYDAVLGNLMKIDDKPSIKLSSPLRNILNRTPMLTFLLEEDRILYTVDSTTSVDKYDLYGFYNTSYHFIAKEIQWFNNQFVYYKAPQLMAYNTQTLVEKTMLIPDANTAVQVRTERQKIFVRRIDSVDIYDY